MTARFGLIGLVRLVRLGKRPTQELPYIPLVSVPACPLEQDWLRIALDAFIQLAVRWSCGILPAWQNWIPFCAGMTAP
ncbi:MAG: hypothetical protein IPN92_14670 [Chromatiaceae bacterium]|nr:hypothetical protein [Chromatiaceae bacterium]